jgi:N-methylhydantoinase B
MDVDLQALAGPRERLTLGGTVDPVTAEVIRGAMETVCYEMAMYVSRAATTPILNHVVGQKYPMPGIAGGGPGAPNRLTLRFGSPDAFVVKHTADWEPLEAGEKINFDYGGGGGWGDPLDRPAAAVLDDVLDEYVSVESARRDYGVVLVGSLEDLTLGIDEAATSARRADMRAARPAA